MRKVVCNPARVHKSYVLPLYDIFVPRHDGKAQCTYRDVFDCTHLCSDELLHEPYLSYFQADLQEHNGGSRAAQPRTGRAKAAEAAKLRQPDVRAEHGRRRSS